MSEAHKEPPTDLLRATSRSFYLIPQCGTLLLAAVRQQLGLVKRIGLAREGGLKF